MARLINKETGKEVKVGDTLTDFRGDTAILKGFREPHKPSSTGRVIVDEGGSWDSEYFPSVYGLEIVDHQFSDKPKTKKIGDKVYISFIQ